MTALARNIEGVAQAKRTEIDRALGILVDVKHSVERAAEEIRALNATVTDINRFVASVGQIADQTNLLALERRDRSGARRRRRPWLRRRRR